MSWAAVAIGAGTIIGGVISSQASKDAADTAADASARSAEQIQGSIDRARRDVLQLSPQAQQSLLTGAQGAIDIFGQAIPEQQRQLTAGNIAAQQTQQQGFQNVQNALLGLPQQSFQTQAVPFAQQPFQPQIIGSPRTFDFSGAKATLPTFQGLGNIQPLAVPVTPPTPAEVQAAAAEGGGSFLGSSGPGEFGVTTALGGGLLGGAIGREVDERLLGGAVGDLFQPVSGAIDKIFGGLF